MDSFVSLRPLIQEKVEPFATLFGEHAEAASQLLIEIMVSVAHYREEGHPLAPVVFFATSLEELLAVTHGSRPVSIGEGPIEPQTARMALKSCIPLGEGRQWAVYLLMSGHQLEFGVFCTERSPLRVTSFEALRLNRKRGTQIAGITGLGENLVEICAGQGLQQYVDFSGAADLAMHPGRIIREFVRSVTQDAAPELRKQLESFFYRIGVEIFSGAHGVLIAVVRESDSAPRFLADGIWLKEPMDIGSYSETDLALLVSQGDLIRRMMTVDGITVFSSSGKLRAYNCFIREQAVSSPAARRIGGARRRAYEILASRVGDALSAAFYRSQDGAGECMVAK